MEFKQFQIDAQKTDQNPNNREGVLISLLGISGEAGELMSIYKKYLRDGDAYQSFKNSIKEELGDILWYIANIATKYDLSLEEIAQANLAKTKLRWATTSTDTRQATPYDSAFPAEQQFPRKMLFQIYHPQKNTNRIVTTLEGVQVGDPLTDNAYNDDGYRYHDILHLAFLAVLGWSPVLRNHLHRKRKNDLIVDEVEDGGRSIVIEEGVAALIYSYAKEHCWLEGVQILDTDLLKTIRGMVSHLEVNNKSERDWENAILQGFEVWRKFLENRDGQIMVDMDNHILQFLPLS